MHVVLCIVLASALTHATHVHHRCAHDDAAMAALLHAPARGTDMVHPQTYGHQAITVHRRRDALGDTTAPQGAPHIGHPLRIVVSHIDVMTPGKYCAAYGGANSTAPTFTGSTATCALPGEVLTNAKRALLLDVVLPRAIRMHTSRLLLPHAVVGNLTIASTSVCPYFTVPDTHAVMGVPNADFALYVGAGLTNGSTMAWAGSCQLDQAGRPVVGRLNFNPNYLPDNATDQPEVLERAVRVAAHELAHALGFSASVIFAQPNMTSTVDENVRGKTAVRVVTSPGVVAAARTYFNCTNISFVELENEGGAGTAGSHWERRNHLEELMSGVVDRSLYSNLTVQLFLDSGLYVANNAIGNRSGSSLDEGGMMTNDDDDDDAMMRFGRGAQCGFLSQLCLLHGSRTGDNQEGPEPEWFCNDTEAATDDTLASCTWDHKAVGHCMLGAQSIPPPAYATSYFAPANASSPKPFYVGLEPLLDGCPFVRAFSSWRCTDTAAASPAADPLTGQWFGATSRCMAVDGVHRNDTVGSVGAAMCIRVRCPQGRRIQFSVGGADAPWSGECPLDGRSGAVTTGHPSYVGRVHCPDARALCHDASLWVAELPTTVGVADTTATPVATSTTIAWTTVALSAAPTTSTTLPSPTPSSTSTSPPVTTSTTSSPPTTNNRTARFLLSTAVNYSVAALLDDVRLALALSGVPSSWTVVIGAAGTATNTTVDVVFETQVQRDAAVGAATAPSQPGSRFAGILSAEPLLPAASPTTTTAPPSPPPSCAFCPSERTIIVISGGSGVLVVMVTIILCYRHNVRRALAKSRASYSEEALRRTHPPVARPPPPPTLPVVEAPPSLLHLPPPPPAQYFYSRHRPPIDLDLL